jgi:hypothetical protein
MGGSPVTPAPPLESTALLSGAPDPAVAGGDDSCPNCGALRGGRFCEECGFDYELAALLPSVPATGAAEAGTGSGAERNGHAPAGAVAAEADGATEVGPPEAERPEAEHPEVVAAEPDGTPLEAPDVGPGTNGTSSRPVPATAAANQLPDNPSPGARALAVVVTADREYYAAQIERGDIVESEFPFPKYPGERRFALDADVIRIGRASASRGIAVEIDLTGPPLDPAVSHLHAQLLRDQDGGWRLVDLGSANGTRLNGAEQPVPVETEIPVKAGDRIHVGVWTTLTVEEA